jgi:hypothetical protein
MTDPLELLYSWQALLCAVACVGVTSMVKTAIDIRIGADRRKRSKVLSQLVLPMTPIWIGAAYAMAVPLHPEVLDAYLTAKGLDSFPRLAALCAWGGACGQFATYSYERVEGLIRTGGRP